MNGLVKFPNFLLHYMFQLACDVFLSLWGSLRIWQLPKPWRKPKVFHHSFCSPSVHPCQTLGAKMMLFFWWVYWYIEPKLRKHTQNKKVVLLEHNSKVFLTRQNEDNKKCKRRCCKEGSRTLIWCLISVSQELEQQFTISIPWLSGHLHNSVISGLAQTVCCASHSVRLTTSCRAYIGQWQQARCWQIYYLKCESFNCPCSVPCFSIIYSVF